MCSLTSTTSWVDLTIGVGDEYYHTKGCSSNLRWIVPIVLLLFAKAFMGSLWIKLYWQDFKIIASSNFMLIICYILYIYNCIRVIYICKMWFNFHIKLFKVGTIILRVLMRKPKFREINILPRDTLLGSEILGFDLRSSCCDFEYHKVAMRYD